jgi:predicted amidohydrolase YtcJ
MDAARPVAEAVLVKSDHIVAVGDAELRRTARQFKPRRQAQ